MTEISADLLACLEEIAADLAEDDGTGWRVRSAFLLVDWCFLTGKY
jgi:hypothetical protein